VLATFLASYHISYCFKTSLKQAIPRSPGPDAAVQARTMGYLSFGPMAQCVVHALKGWLAARVSLRQARLPRTAQRSRRLRSTRAAATVLLAHANVTKNIKYFSMGPKLRHLTVPALGIA
jgi:hypothetical protein